MRAHQLICLLPLFVLGCELVEPDRVFNNEPGRTKTAIVYVNGIDSSRSYAGSINIEFIVDSIDFPLKQVDCYLDNLPLASWFAPPYRIVIDTRQYSHGDHNFVLAFYASGQGLLSARGFYSALRAFSVRFDQTPPDTVSIVSLEWSGNHPTIKWRRSASRNFYCYVLENRVSPYETLRDTIQSVMDTTLTDTTVTKAIGVRTAAYSIGVSNRVNSVFGSIRSIGFGEEIPIYFSSYAGRRRHLIPSKVRPEVYYYDASTSTFSVVSTLSHTTLYNMRILNVQDMRLREQEDSLFILTNSAYSFYKFSPVTRTLDSITNTQGAFLMGASFVLGRPNRCYFSGYGLRTIQLSPWTQLSYMFHEGHFVSRLIEISPDKNNLYHVFDSNNLLYHLDVRTDTPQVVSQHAVPGNPCCSVGFALSTNTDEILFASTFQVEVLEAGTLQTKRVLQFSEGTGTTVFLTHVEVTDGYAYVSYSVLRQYPGIGAPAYGKIVQVRKSDWSVQQSWVFNPPVIAFVILPNDSQIYASSSDGHGWIVNIE